MHLVITLAAALASVAAPAGTPSVRWLQVEARGLGALSAAVAEPAGTGPFPAVLILHGTHGFAEQYVELARALARRGVVAVAACWFAGRRGEGTRFITPIECPDAPAVSLASSDTAFAAVDALVEAVRTQPHVRADRVAIFGHSRGGGAALHYVLKGGAVQALILNSTGYPDDVIGRVGEITVPVLLLHGTADRPADGGSAITDVQRAHRFERAMRHARRTIQARYYKGGGHNSVFASPTQRDDEVRRTAAFVRRHLVR